MLCFWRLGKCGMVMKISDVARQTGLTVKSIRYYENIGLIPPPSRTQAGYRVFSPKDLHRLHFIRRARSLGFGVEECRQLLSLYDDRSRASADVKSVALNRISDIDHKIAALEDMRRILADLADQCQGDDRPDCPILADIARVST